MGKLINIDNGGTLTDVCVIDGDAVYRTKTLTTPHDLSRCFFDGLAKASAAIYGREDLVSLLLSTDHIRYSTTQGTNALVERKGPRLGLILTGGLSEARLKAGNSGELLDAMAGGRIEALDAQADDATLEVAATKAVNKLTSAGANRVVVAHGGGDCVAVEGRLKRILLRKFPQHLLGAVPILYSHEVVDDPDDVRRAWTALFNAFLHPAMERFLYNAEHRLRENKARKPLLIFRNDGHSARVAKTIAVKTYSSGPRGGMEGARALARQYGYRHLLTMDIGGTTTDIGEVREGGDIRVEPHGRVEGVPVSFPLCDVVSVGVGGSSIIRVVDGALRVGPESVGSAPGPACFGLGGREATITDAFLVTGLLDPASYFGGGLKIDVERARAAIEEKVAAPLGLSVDAAAAAMEKAWVEKVAANLRAYAEIGPDTVLAAFGGAGPFVVCKVAEAAGISRVIIPGLAAVFSAYGLGFSDIAQEYEQPLERPDQAALDAALLQLRERLERGMFAEGFALDECELEAWIKVTQDDIVQRLPLGDGRLPAGLTTRGRVAVAMSATKRLPRPAPSAGRTATPGPAHSEATREVALGDARLSLPLYPVQRQAPGARAAGPAVLEEAFYTCRVDAGWRFDVNDGGDIVLQRA